MAVRAFGRRRPVEKDAFAANHPKVLVTVLATHVSVRALKREGGAPVVIERRGFPGDARVTTDALGDPSHRKLSCMHVGMAAFACNRSQVEIHVRQPPSDIYPLVAR